MTQENQSEKEAREKLLEFWEKWEPGKHSLHPSDEEKINKNQYFDVDTFTAELQEIPGLAHKILKSKKIVPVPFVGNLKDARVFILSGNTGGSIDYSQIKKLKTEELPKENDIECKNLKGKATKFFYLEEKSEDYKYWYPRFNNLAKPEDIALIQAIPYRSAKNPEGLKHPLPSSEKIRDYVRDSLVPKMHRGEIFIFMFRKFDFWNLGNLSIAGAPNNNQHPTGNGIERFEAWWENRN